MTAAYQEVAALISGIRNARYGEMVKYSEQLIDSGAWRDFITPAGTHFEFRACEYDYFLAAMEADATTLRHAYINKAPADKLMRLADITGRGKPPKEGERRDRAEVVELYRSDPSGAAARIEAWAKEKVVTDTYIKIAQDSDRRARAERGQPQPRPIRRRWLVEWTDDKRALAESIAEKLLTDPDLAHEVYKRLEAGRVRTRRDKKRRSGAKSAPDMDPVAVGDN